MVGWYTYAFQRKEIEQIMELLSHLGLCETYHSLFPQAFILGRQNFKQRKWRLQRYIIRADTYTYFTQGECPVDVGTQLYTFYITDPLGSKSHAEFSTGWSRMEGETRPRTGKAWGGDAFLPDSWAEYHCIDPFCVFLITQIPLFCQNSFSVTAWAM